MQEMSVSHMVSIGECTSAQNTRLSGQKNGVSDMCREDRG
jgi:hypothetical protein